MTTEQYSIGYEAGYQDGFNEALAEQDKQEPVAKERILELAKQERVLIPGLIGFQDSLVEFARAVIKVYQEKNK